MQALVELSVILFYNHKSKPIGLKAYSMFLVKLSPLKAQGAVLFPFKILSLFLIGAV